MIDRRSFIKVCVGTLAAIGVVAIPTLPQDAVAQIKPEPKHPKDVVCRDFQPQITIQDYRPGEPMVFQDLRMDGDCEMCQFENRCLCSGVKFELYGNDKNGKWQPELWNRKLQNKWYRQVVKGAKA